MRKIVVLLSAVVFAGMASTVSAKVNHARTSSAHIKANQTKDTPGSPCPDGYANHCPAGGATCECFEFSGSINGNQAGKGSATVELTVDNAPSDRTATPGCRPVYATVSIIANKDSGQSLGMVGALCDGANANSTDPLNGGYGIDSSQAGLNGAGTFTGGVRPNGKLDLKLSGFVQPSI